MEIILKTENHLSFAKLTCDMADTFLKQFCFNKGYVDNSQLKQESIYSFGYKAKVDIDFITAGQVHIYIWKGTQILIKN